MLNTLNICLIKHLFNIYFTHMFNICIKRVKHMKNMHVKHMCSFIYVSHMLNICSTYVVLNMYLTHVEIFSCIRVLPKCEYLDSRNYVFHFVTIK